MKYGIDQFKSLCVIEDAKIIGMNGLDSAYQSFDFKGNKVKVLEGDFPDPSNEKFHFDYRKNWVFQPKLEHLEEREIKIEINVIYKFYGKWEEIEPFSVKIKFIKEEVVREVNQYLEDFAFNYCMSKAPQITEFTVIKEANKTRWYDVIDHLDGKKFLVLHKYTTTCGNYTLCLHPVTDYLKIPEKYIGLIIGKKGVNIKMLREKYNLALSISKNK